MSIAKSDLFKKWVYNAVHYGTKIKNKITAA